MSLTYAEHHLHSDFSSLDGVSTADDYMRRAKEIGVEHLTITDHGTLAGHRAFQDAGIKHGINVGLGVEGYFSVTDRFDRRAAKTRNDGTEVSNHIGVIAKNAKGLENLQALTRVAWTEGFYNKPRFDIEALEEYREGLIVLSGCRGGVISKYLEAGDYDTAKEWAGRFKSIMGDDYYMEVMAHNPADMTAGHFQIADELGIKPIVTSDCHHATENDLILQEAMLILSSKPKINPKFDFSKSEKMDLLERFNYVYPDRKLTFEKYDLHLHTGTSQFKKFEAMGYDRTDYIESTVEIAGKIGEYPVHKGLDLLPKPKNKDIDALLRNLVMAGLEKRGLADNQEYLDRINHELKIIKDKGFATYFIILEDIVRWARGQGILVGPGRGSAAGSLVNYALFITNVDPIKYHLIFERFLNPDRPDWPDVDMDFPADRRAEVKAYAKKKFKHTGNLMTFTYFEGKNIVKNACTVLRIPFAEANKMTKHIVDFDDYLTSTKKEVVEFRRRYPQVAELGIMFRGRLHSIGMHAAGVAIANAPLDQFLPVQTANNPDKSSDRVEVLAVDGDGAAEIGIIKYDFLGLTALENIQNTIDYVEKHHDIKIDLDSIDLDDPVVYGSINKRSTLGLFQMEGSAFTNVLNSVSIETFDDVAAATALIRPGAANSRFGKQYLDFKNKGKFHSIHPDVDWITAKTSGVLYQEQVMQLCVHLAGMTVVESEKVRKAVGKKKQHELELWEERFVTGAAEKIGKDEAQDLWDDIVHSADYSFNLSHSVAYSIVTYWTMWLKHYYPLEFMLSLLKTETDVVKRLNYLNECKRLGIRIKLPHVNRSELSISREVDDKGECLRLGLSDIKYVGAAAGNKLIKARPFESLEHLKTFAAETYSGVNVRNIDSMDKVGAVRFDDNPLRGDEKEYYYEYLALPVFDSSRVPDAAFDVLTKIEDITESGTHFVLALVSEITRKNGWARADLFDETGNHGAFFNPSWSLSKGDYMIFLIVNGSIAKMVPMDEFGTGSGIDKFLSTERLKPFDGHRVIDFVYTERNGKMRGELIVTDQHRVVSGGTVMGQFFYQVHTAAKPGRILSNFETAQNTYKGRTSTLVRKI